MTLGIERDGSSVVMFTAFFANGVGNGVVNHVVSCELCLPVQIMEWEVSIVFVVDGNGNCSFDEIVVCMDDGAIRP